VANVSGTVSTVLVKGKRGLLEDGRVFLVMSCGFREIDFDLAEQIVARA
jgi:hypothetical protein